MKRWLMSLCLSASASVAVGAPARPARAEHARIDTSTSAAEDCEASACEDDEAITPDLEGPAVEPIEVQTATRATVERVPPGVDADDLLAIELDELMYRASVDPVEPQALLEDVHALEREAPPVKWPEHDPAVGPTWDIPLAEDPRVQLWINYFQGSGRERFQTWLGRLTRFAPLFWPILEHHGLPRDTIFLSMIESGFSTRATSWAAAAGPWQFMPATGRNYGLEVGMWVDDRRDPERSTEAAARYLKALYDEFGDWQLAWAAYNTGEGRIRRCVKRTGSNDFWRISRTGLLYRETKHYVPKLIAAALVAKAPERYGFENTEYLAPLEWETITVTAAVDLKTVASACGSAVSEEDLRALNPSLYRGVTPPGREWELRVPVGARGGCAVGLSRLPVEARTTFRLHRVARGQSIEAIAARYFTTPRAILDYNRITPSQLSIYDAIIVPIPLSAAHRVPVGDDEQAWARQPPFTPQSGARPILVHRVRPGDSLWRVARRYGVGLAQLRSWNGLWRSGTLRVGQLLRIQR